MNHPSLRYRSSHRIRVVVIGGGIAGTETALTIALGHPNADVTLVSQSPSLCIRPNLVYVPLGIAPSRIDTPLGPALDEVGARLHVGLVERVDMAARTVTSDTGQLQYDVLVACPGTIAEPVDGYPLRTLDDALRLRSALNRVLSRSATSSIVVRQLPDDTWSAPGYEFAMLLRAWLVAREMPQVKVTIATSDSSPFLLFGNVECSDLVAASLAELGIEVIRGIPPGRIEGITGDMNIDLGALRARPIPGFAHVDIDGFYRVRDDGSVADAHFVVGDAADLPYKAAFATSWQARRVLHAIGGDMAGLGTAIDDVPVSHCEYHMDMVHRTLVARIATGSRLSRLAADTRVDVSTRSEPPDKLRGTLVSTIIHPDAYEMNAARRFHDWLANTGHAHSNSAQAAYALCDVTRDVVHR